MPSTLPAEKIPLYEELAQDLSGQIEQGTFRLGERIPSVRQLSEQRNISVTTILRAYRLLEDRGLIEARPQSGYFVQTHPIKAMPGPDMSAPSPDPTQVSIAELTLMVLRDTLKPNLVQFGAAIPHPDLLPTAKLNRILASVVRRVDVPQNVCGAPEGRPELRVQVAQRAFAAGCHLSPDDIIITSGCLEAISLALRAVCRPGDAVAIESPTYYGILQALESQGLTALEIPTDCKYGMSLDALRFALDHHPVRACLTLTNFSNPLGSCMPEDHKKELVELLAERDIPLIEDDIHGDLYFSGQRPSVAKSYDRKGLVMLCSSFSKDISPSYRVGWIAPGQFVSKLQHLKMATNVSTATLPQIAISEFLSSGSYEHHLRRIRRAYAQKVTQMAQGIMRYFPEGTRVTTPAGGFVLWVQMPDTVDSLVLYKQALKVGITLAPGYIFSATPQYRNFIRLNAAYWSYEAEKALQRLGKLVHNLAGAT